MRLAPLPAGGRTIRFPVLDDELSLLWAINMGCIDLNVWCAREDLPERPDAVIFDLDPAAPASFDEARQVALLVRDVLASVDLRAYPRTSGSVRGLHVLVPIARRHTHGEARELVAAIGAALAYAHPGLVTTKWAKTERKGVLIDANQNGYGRTTAWAYSVRPRPGALVATPVTWEELEKPLDTTQFTMDGRAAAGGASRRPAPAGAGGRAVAREGAQGAALSAGVGGDSGAGRLVGFARSADVAQLVEHQLPKLRVAGSSPVVRLAPRSTRRLRRPTPAARGPAAPRAS